MKAVFFPMFALALWLVGCSGAVDSGNTTPDAEQGGDAGTASMPAPVDRACVTGEEAFVSPFGLSLTGYGCTEVVNQSGIPGARAWCCPSGAIEGEQAGTGGAP